MLETTIRYESLNLELASPSMPIQVDPARENLATPPFPLAEPQTGFLQLLKPRLQNRVLALRGFWRTG